jgi:hypothetical protein
VVEDPEQRLPQVVPGGCGVTRAGRTEPHAVAFAHGLQDPGHGAEPVVPPKPNGGWAFSVGSLCSNGALAGDPAMARILRNAVAVTVR